MRTAPELKKVINGERGILEGIKVCLGAECLVSAVALIFSGIESLAALTRPSSQDSTTRAEFKDWVAKYLLPYPSLPCDADDLYAARCGVLHTYSPESDLQRRGKAGRIFYQWRSGPAADAIVTLPPDSIVIEIEVLHEALKSAIQKFLTDVDTDSELEERVLRNLEPLFCYAPFPALTFEGVSGMDLSQLKWLKNVKADQGWAYDKLNEMPIPEARIFRLHWRSQDGKDNAQQLFKGDLVALVQSARVTHIVELLEDVVYENTEKEWNLYRVVKAVWMPPEGFNWNNLPHQREIFGIEDLPADGAAHDLSRTDRMHQFNHHWKDLEGLQGFQKHLGKILTEISLVT